MGYFTEKYEINGLPYDKERKTLLKTDSHYWVIRRTRQNLSYDFLS